jgi:hypothetical protein
MSARVNGRNQAASTAPTYRVQRRDGHVASRDLAGDEQWHPRHQGQRQQLQAAQHRHDVGPPPPPGAGPQVAHVSEHEPPPHARREGEPNAEEHHGGRGQPHAGGAQQAAHRPRAVHHVLKLQRRRAPHRHDLVPVHEQRQPGEHGGGCCGQGEEQVPAGGARPREFHGKQRHLQRGRRGGGGGGGEVR